MTISHAPELTGTRRRILSGHRHVTFLGMSARNLSTSIVGGRVRIDVITSHGHHVDIDTTPADALELGLALIAHAERVAHTGS